MTGKDERRETGLGNLNAELLRQLADQAFFGGFTLDKLTAGEFPEPFQRFTTRSLSYENPPFAVDQGGRGDQNERLWHHF